MVQQLLGNVSHMPKSHIKHQRLRRRQHSRRWQTLEGARRIATAGHQRHRRGQITVRHRQTQQRQTADASTDARDNLPRNAVGS